MTSGQRWLTKACVGIACVGIAWTRMMPAWQYITRSMEALLGATVTPGGECERDSDCNGHGVCEEVAWAAWTGSRRCSCELHYTGANCGLWAFYLLAVLSSAATAGFALLVLPTPLRRDPRVLLLFFICCMAFLAFWMMAVSSWAPWLKVAGCCCLVGLSELHGPANPPARAQDTDQPAATANLDAGDDRAARGIVMAMDPGAEVCNDGHARARRMGGMELDGAPRVPEGKRCGSANNRGGSATTTTTRGASGSPTPAAGPGAASAAGAAGCRTG